MKTIYILFIMVFLTGLTSCKKFLDVKPITQISSDVNFKDEQGYKDALTGVYVAMTNPNLYGKELSFGFVDVLGKNYTQFFSSNNYYQDANYNYQYAATKSRIDNIWNGNYSTIANINNLIDNIDKADKNIFTGTNYNVIRGEAYGLRAFNHFDLLRLYAPSPAAGGMNTPSIPYHDKLSTDVVALSTVSQVITKIIADLQVASAMLKTADPIVLGSTVQTTASGYLRGRQYKFNYYAVRALLARVYLYAGDKVNALACATEVINSTKFPAITINQIFQGDRIFSSEVIFNLNINTIQSLYDASFSENNSVGMYLAYSQWKTVYETNNGGSADYRYLYQTHDSGNFQYSSKLNPADNGNAANRLPLMRVSEMYYIAAECLESTDPLTAIGYLNTVRKNRNLLPLDLSLSAQQIQNEVFKEYTKEFFCEGQLFFYYKRLNLSSIQFSQITAGPAVYVLPKPDNEIEYGSH